MTAKESTFFKEDPLKKVLFIWEEDMNLTIQKTKEEKLTTLRNTCNRIMDKMNKTKEMTEEEKQEKLKKILTKLKAGRKLTDKELAFLKCTDRTMYMHAVRVQKMAEAVEEQLKHAKSKEEANRILSQAMSGVSDQDPDKEYLTAAYNRIASEFRKSRHYNTLPATADDTRKNNKVTDKELFKPEKDDPNLKNWSPIREIIDQMPAFTAEG